MEIDASAPPADATFALDPAPGRIGSLDLCRLAAAFAVVFIHTSLVTAWGRPGHEVNPAMLANAVCRFAVPFFFVISGYFWGLKVSGASSTVVWRHTVKSIKRVGLVLIVWSIFYLAWPSGLVDLVQGRPADFARRIYYQARFTIDTPGFAMPLATFHLWFLVSMLYCLGIAGLFVSRGRAITLLVLSILLFVFALLGKPYTDTPVGFSIAFDLRDGPFFGLIFFVSGFFLQSFGARPSWLQWGILVAVLGFSMHIAEMVALHRWFGTTMLQDFYVGTYFAGDWHGDGWPVRRALVELPQLGCSGAAGVGRICRASSRDDGIELCRCIAWKNTRRPAFMANTGCSHLSDCRGHAGENQNDAQVCSLKRSDAGGGLNCTTYPPSREVTARTARHRQCSCGRQR